MMMLTILDFLVGEEINIFLPGIKIERMHAQHPKRNSQIFPLVVTVIRKGAFSLHNIDSDLYCPPGRKHLNCQLTKRLI